MKATLEGRIIADSDDVIECGGYLYFPRPAVRMDCLEKAEKTADDLECPHGVQFYDVTDGSETSERAAWSYEAPKTAMKEVDHWIGFWELQFE